MPLAESPDLEPTEVESEVARVCGVINAATGDLVGLIGEVLESGSWQGLGVVSPQHWVSLHCGMSSARARRLVAAARRRRGLCQTMAALSAGELSEDQVAVVVRHVPDHNDAEAAELARSATVAQLGRILGSYGFSAGAPSPKQRNVSFGSDDDGTWHLFARLGAEEGAVVEAALERLRASGGHDNWADAFLDAFGGCRSDRFKVMVHLDGDGPVLARGPGLGSDQWRWLFCDVGLAPVWHQGGRATSVGRSQRLVPERTRSVIEHRDGGCRLPGCDHRRWLEIHHIVAWSEGGATDTSNLVALCSRHHRMHHQGEIHIRGDADFDLVFTDHRGRPIGGPSPPRGPTDGEHVPAGNWHHPPGERYDPDCIWFSEAPAPV